MINTISFLIFQAGLRTLHDMGPQIKRAISGNLEGMDENELFEQEEPNHRVSVLRHCVDEGKMLRGLQLPAARLHRTH